MMLRKKNIAEAKKWAEPIDRLDDEGFNKLVERWRRHELDVKLDEPYNDLRARIVSVFDDAGGLTLKNRTMYPVDVEVGLALYEELDGFGISVEDACNDDFWRYLSIVVFPDITYMRYPDPEKEQGERGGRLNHKRFFSMTRRIWVKTLWWYVHLSWQGSTEATREVLNAGSADGINKLIETPGRGYRPEFYRAFMARFAKSPARSSKTIGRAKKLSNARCRIIEPELTIGGVEGYCDRLFAEIEARR